MFMENYTIFLSFSIRNDVGNEKGYIVKVNLTSSPRFFISSLIVRIVQETNINILST